MKKLLVFVSMLVLVGVVGAVVIEPGVDLAPSGGNFSMNMTSNFTFDAVTVNPNEVVLDNSTNGGFNQTFSIEADTSTINISLIRVRNTSDLVNNFRLWIEFNATNTGGATESNITIGVFEANENIRVFHDGVRNNSLDSVANSTGFFNFSWTFDGRQNFEIRSRADVAIVSPTNSTFTDPFVELNVISFATIDTWLFSLDGAGNVTFTPNVTLFRLSPGLHSVRVWGNLSTGEFRTDIVFFTMNYTENTTSFLPPTPPSGEGDVGFTGSPDASAGVEAYQPFTVRVRLNDSSVSSFGSPVLFFLSSEVVSGTWSMHFLNGTGGLVLYERSISLPPGNFTYWVKVFDDLGVSHVSDNRSLRVFTRLAVNLSLPPLVTFTGSTPRSHDVITRVDGVTVSGLTQNIANLDNATLFVLDELGENILSTDDLLFTLMADGNYSLSGHSSIPNGSSRVVIQIGVRTTGNDSAYSVRRILTVVDSDPDNFVKNAFSLFGDSIPADRGSPEIKTGRIIASLIMMVGLMAISFQTGAGAVAATSIGLLAGIELAIYDVFPGYAAITAVLLVSVVLSRVLIAIFSNVKG